MAVLLKEVKRENDNTQKSSSPTTGKGSRKSRKAEIQEVKSENSQKVLQRSKDIKKVKHESQESKEKKSSLMKRLTERFQLFKKMYNSEIVKVYKDTKELI